MYVFNNYVYVSIPLSNMLFTKIFMDTICLKKIYIKDKCISKLSNAFCNTTKIAQLQF